MTHPDYLCVHLAGPGRGATVLHRDRPDEDPAGAPSGLRWRPVSGGWWGLFSGSACLGTVERLFADWRWEATMASADGWRRVNVGSLATVARELVRELRRR